jgi:hypothetical protein
MAFYTKIEEEHWLRDRLEDESVWEIDASDRQRTKRWLRISTVTVKYTQKASYPYVLSNRTEGEDARANYLGESASRMRIAPEVA